MQKPAYDMHISDWSSDVCSSDLLALALGRYLADQNVASAHFGTDVDHTRFIQARQRMLGHIRDVGGDFLRPQLGVAGNAGQLFDVAIGRASTRERVCEHVTI